VTTDELVTLITELGLVKIQLYDVGNGTGLMDTEMGVDMPAGMVMGATCEMMDGQIPTFESSHVF